MKIKNVKARYKLGTTLIMALLVLCAFEVTSDITYKQGTDSSGNSWDGPINTICNSNSRVWEATTANIQTALDAAVPSDANPYSKRGEVHLPGNTSFTVTTTIEIPQGVCLYMHGSRFYANTNIEVVKMNRRSELHDGVIWIGSVPTTAVGIAIEGHATTWVAHQVVISNMKLRTTNEPYNTGMHFYADSPNERVELVQVSDCSFVCFDKAIHLESTGGTSGNIAWVNGNVFLNIRVYSCGYGFYLSESCDAYNAVNGNEFDGYQIQYDGVASSRAIYCDGLGNQFRGATWDWGLTKKSMEFTSNSARNFIVDSELWNYYDNGTDNHVLALGVGTGVSNIGFFKFPVWKPKIYAQSAEPNIPTNSIGFWNDTDTNQRYLIFDEDTIQKTVEIGASGNIPLINPCEYTIYIDGSNYKAMDSTGALADSETVFRTLMNDRTLAMAGSPSDSGRIILKSGTYTWGSDLSITNGGLGNLSIIGENKYTTIIKAGATDDLATGFFNADGYDNITIQDLTFDGSNRNIALMQFKNAENLLIENCVIKNMNYVAITLGGTVSNVVIRNCEFINCCMNDNQLGVIYLNDGLADSMIYDNTFEWTTNPTSLMFGAFACYPSAGDCIENISICNNKIGSNISYTNVDRGISLNAGATNYIITNITISNNRIYANDEAIFLNFVQYTMVTGNILWSTGDAFKSDNSGSGIKFDVANNMENGL